VTRAASGAEAIEYELRLVAVLGRQAKIDVLARAMARPAGDVEDDRRHARGLRDHLDDVAQRPSERPRWRG
jgi:hypothetical protein